MPVPFRIIDWYDYGFPECWKMIDFKMTDNNDGVVPIYKYYEKLMHFMLKFDLPDEETSYACASILLTMAIWRTNKQIFVFYKEMLEVLFEQKPDFNIPTEILNQLPYPCIYFDLNGFDNLEGMLVVKEEHEDGRKGPSSPAQPCPPWRGARPWHSRAPYGSACSRCLLPSLRAQSADRHPARAASTADATTPRDSGRCRPDRRPSTSPLRRRRTPSGKCARCKRPRSHGSRRACPTQSQGLPAHRESSRSVGSQ